MTTTTPYAWEITTIIPDAKTGAKRRCSAVVMAHSIDDVWEWLAADRADANTEIESIVRFAPIVAVLIPPEVAEAAQPKGEK